MIRSGVTIRSVRRATWEQHAAALMSCAGDVENMQPFELLAVNHDSYALVRNVRGCIYLGAYAGRGVLEFVLHILRCGYSCIFSTKYPRAAQRVFHGLYSDMVRDPEQARTWFFIPAGSHVPV
jgi:hypothetical protein